MARTPEYDRIYHKAYRAAHLEEEKARQKIYYAEHKEYVSARSKAYYEAHREERNAKGRIYEKAHREQANASRRALEAKWRLDVITHYGGKCACCGETTYEFLAIDHINGGGRKHKIDTKIRNLSRWLIVNNYPDGFQILCHNCNCAKGFYGECPHERMREC